MKNHTETPNRSRRRFVRAGAAAVVAVPLASLLAQRPSLAQEKVEESDPTAQALGYVHDASTTDNEKYEEGQLCSNCQYYLKAQEQDGWAPCPIIQNKLVNGDGWCNVWVAAPA